MEEFTLYQTLSKNLKPTTMNNKQMSELAKKLSCANHLAVARLILEHYQKTESQRNVDIENPKLPYGGIQKGDEVVFDIKKIPNELRWILMKFVNLT